jgi:CysZ protein
MHEVISAFSKSLRDLTRGEVLWQALWPPLVALLVWIAVGLAVWTHGVALMSRIVPQLPWSGWEWVAQWAAIFLLLAAFASLTYITAILLVAVVAMPRLINLVAVHHYPELGRHGQNVFWGSLANTLVIGAIFVIGSLVTLPLLLIPGALLVLPLMWSAWLNQRTFRFDALAEHATRTEMQNLVRDKRNPFYIAGLATAGVAHLPLINLLAPAFAALVFVHLGLAALRRQRQEGGVVL